MKAGIVLAVAALALGCGHRGESKEKRLGKGARGELPAPLLDSSEPPLRFALEIDGEATAIVPGQPLAIGPKESATEVILRLDPYREFARGGVRFLYPRTYTFEQDKETAYKGWTLSGNDQTIMIFCFPNLDKESRVDALIPGIVSQYGEENVKVTPYTMTLNGITLTGKSLLISLASMQLRQDVISIDSESAMCTYVFQDGLDDDGNPTKEAQVGMQILNATLEVL